MSNNRKFLRSMDRATSKRVQEISENMARACLIVDREAKINCPIDQGHLRAAMDYDVSITDSEIVGTNFNSSEIAPYVHQGTGIYAVNGDGRKTPWKYKVEKGKYEGWHVTQGQKPQPFLEKAKINNKEKILNALAGD